MGLALAATPAYSSAMVERVKELLWGTACAFGAWIWGHLPSTWGIPEWLGYVAILLIGGLGLIIHWVRLYRRAQLSDAQKHILGLMQNENTVFICPRMQMPEMVRAGGHLLYGKGEKPSKHAPISLKYVEALESLKASGHLRPIGDGTTWQYSEKGARVADKLLGKFRVSPPDVAPSMPRLSLSPVQDTALVAVKELPLTDPSSLHKSIEEIVARSTAGLAEQIEIAKNAQLTTVAALTEHRLEVEGMVLLADAASCIHLFIYNKSLQLPASIDCIGLCTDELPGGSICMHGSDLDVQTLPAVRNTCVTFNITDVADHMPYNNLHYVNTIFVEFEHRQRIYLRNDHVFQFIEACKAMAQWRERHPERFDSLLGLWRDEDFKLYGPEYW